MLDPFLVVQFARDEYPPAAQAFTSATLQRVHRARRRRVMTRALVFLLAALLAIAAAFGGAFRLGVVNLGTSAEALGQLLALPWVWALTLVVLFGAHALVHAGQGGLR